MDISTYEKFSTEFDTNQKCLDYLAKIRWDGNATCPTCGTDRCYTQTNKQFKCRNKECGTKFHPLIKTAFSSSKIEVTHLFKMMYLYIKSRRSFMSINYTERNIHLTNALIIDLKLKDIFENVEFVNAELLDIFNHGLSNLPSIKTGKDTTYDKNKFFSRSYHIIPQTDDPIDLNDKTTYRNCITVISKLLYYGIHRNWYYLAFATPTEILSETYLYIYENLENDVELTNNIFIAAVKKTLHKMWYKYQMDSPKLKRSENRRAKKHKQAAILNLRKRYVKELMKKSKKYEDIYFHINLNEEIEKYRQLLIEKRKKRNNGITNNDFISHFA